jgi:hypothetical protein
MRCRALLQLASVGVFGLVTGLASAADYSGRYEDGTLAVTLTGQNGGYGGEIVMGQQRFPVQASEQGTQLNGSFVSDGNQFPFAAAFQADALVLSTGGKTYTLHRAGQGGALPQPLPQPQQMGAMPVAAAGDPNALADFGAINGSQYGKVLSRQFPANTSAKAALQTTFPALARFFGARPTILGAYEDQKDHKSVGVSYSAQLNGQPVKGFVSAKVLDQGTSVLIVYCASNAPQGELGRLMKRPAPAAGANGQPAGNGQTAGNGQGGAADLQTAIAQVPLQTYTFPDNTGSVGIAQGWTTNAQTIGGATITGPGDQKIVMGVGAEVITPDSQMIRMHNQLNANGMRMGGKPMAPINMLIAPVSPDAATTFKSLMDAINVMNRAKANPTTTLERIVQANKTPSMSPKGTAAAIIFDFNKSDTGPNKHYRALIQFEYYFVGQSRDTWAFYATQLTAPAETFKQDLPVMLAQTNSLKENAAVIQQKTQQKIAAQNQWFQAQQAAQKKVEAAYDQQHKDWEHNQLIQDRSNANFDEYIRGYRTVQDTSTGDKTSVDLGNVHQVVENLNYYDPGRYKEIPLRDELYPLPGQQGQ